MSFWREEEIFHEGDVYFERMVLAIQRARATIDLESYIFDQDRLGTRMLNHLALAAARGVRVRLLLDGAGCSSWGYRDVERVRGMGIDLRIYHPLPWQVRPRRFLWESFAPRRLRLRLAELNRRNHRKTCLIDGVEAFAGGMNVSDFHLKEWSGEQAWRDIAVRVRGPGVRSLVSAFTLAWRLSGPQRRSRSIKKWLRRRALRRPHRALRLNHLPILRKRLNRERLQRVLQAQTRIWITTPYLVPNLKLLRALGMAARRGVDVRLLTPRQNDLFFMRWINRAFYPVLLQAAVRIFEYRPSFFHGKLMLLDDWIVVGSSNLNHRSLLHDLEADIVLANPESVREVERRFLGDLEASREIRIQELGYAARLKAMIGRLLLVFRRWI